MRSVSRGEDSVGTKENAALVRELYGTLMANGDVTTAERILAPDYVDHDVPGPFPGTREGLIVDLPA
jgi:predicted SnoaL-like aldol condensation-catalyzing enzyme